jgi:hypothetical protein
MQRSDAFCKVYIQGPVRAALLGLRPEAARLAAPPVQPDTARGVQFQLCGPEYWRNPEIMQRVLRR